jgi:hypothetical protein
VSCRLGVWAELASLGRVESGLVDLGTGGGLYRVCSELHLSLDSQVLWDELGRRCMLGCWMDKTVEAATVKCSSVPGHSCL